MSTLNQIKLALTTTIKIIDQLEEDDLPKRPSPHKHSIGELLIHIATICSADLLISSGTSQEEMNTFYSTVSYENLNEIKYAILHHFQRLEEVYMDYTEAELQQCVTSYWGLSYTRYEWLLEILTHVYHHRGQLHAILVHTYGKDPGISMFE